MGLQATQNVRQGTLLLKMAPTHMLAVPLDSSAYDMWRRTYVTQFEQRWGAKLPEDLLEIIPCTVGMAHGPPPVVEQLRLLQAMTVSVHCCVTCPAVLLSVGEFIPMGCEGHKLALAALLLWVRENLPDPFWQNYVQRLSPPDQYTAAGEAWSPTAISQLQWTFLQVWSSARAVAAHQLAPSPGTACGYGPMHRSLQHAHVHTHTTVCKASKVVLLHISTSPCFGAPHVLLGSAGLHVLLV